MTDLVLLPPITNYGSRITDYGSLITNHELRITDYETIPLADPLALSANLTEYAHQSICNLTHPLTHLLAYSSFQSPCIRVSYRILLSYVIRTEAESFLPPSRINLRRVILEIDVLNSVTSAMFIA